MEHPVFSSASRQIYPALLSYDIGLQMHIIPFKVPWNAWRSLVLIELVFACSGKMSSAGKFVARLEA